MPQTKAKKTVKKAARNSAKPKIAKSKDLQLSAFLLLDRSASMRRIWDESVGSMNAYVRELAGQSPEAEVTLATFDSMGSGLAFDILRNAVKAKNWNAVGAYESEPRGNTPLYDAIGRFAGLALGKGTERTVLVIVTDGEENASKTLTKDAAAGLLDACRAKGWQTVFLGADFNNMPQAASLRNDYGSTMSILPDNFVASMRGVAAHTHTYGATGMSVNFTESDRAQASRTTS